MNNRDFSSDGWWLQSTVEWTPRNELKWDKSRVKRTKSMGLSALWSVKKQNSLANPKQLKSSHNLTKRSIASEESPVLYFVLDFVLDFTSNFWSYASICWSCIPAVSSKHKTTIPGRIIHPGIQRYKTQSPLPDIASLLFMTFILVYMEVTRPVSLFSQ